MPGSENQEDHCSCCACRVLLCRLCRPIVACAASPPTPVLHDRQRSREQGRFGYGGTMRALRPARVQDRPVRTREQGRELRGARRATSGELASGGCKRHPLPPACLWSTDRINAYVPIFVFAASMASRNARRSSRMSSAMLVPKSLAMPMPTMPPGRVVLECDLEFGALPLSA